MKRYAWPAILGGTVVVYAMVVSIVVLVAWRQHTDSVAGAGMDDATRIAGILPEATAAATPAPTATPVPVPLVINEFFSTDTTLPPNVDASKVRVLLATGDVIPARFTNYKLSLRNDYTWPFVATIDILKNADISFINLEAPLMQRCPIQTSGLQFCGSNRFLEGLKYAAVDVVNLANNHSGNYGFAGIDETVDALKEIGISSTGVGEILYKDARGVKFAFLGYNGVGFDLDRERMKRQITEARKNADVVVVQFHWGMEYVDFPQRAPGVAEDDPREIGRLAIDSGADLIVGNHPHWVQGVELYKGKLITYAHGNFVFDQAFSRETMEGVIGRYVFYQNQLIQVRYFPTLINDYTQPRLLEGKEAEAVWDRMRQASDKMVAQPFQPR